ncbi:hypothetical protein IIC38_16050 [candidate division KSB1 bacterium]|nr:hypothetical protein [candidate division KSB1 bacterium]
MGALDSLVLLGVFGLVGYFLIFKNPLANATKDIIDLPRQDITSPKQFGFNTTNTLGLIDSAPGLTPFQTALANLRDNLSIGGLLFQGSNTDPIQLPRPLSPNRLRGLRR